MAGILTFAMLAAPFFVAVADVVLLVLVPVLLPPPVPLAWTLLLLALQVKVPLITWLFLSCWKGVQLKLPEDCALKVPLTSDRAGSTALEKLPDMLMAPVVARFGKPSMVTSSLLLAIWSPPPMVFNNGIETLVREASATMAISPPTEVKFGARIESMYEP